MTTAIASLELLYATCGRQQYDDEAVSQLEHACQCAYLAEQSGDDPYMIIACFLHDLGHLLISHSNQHSHLLSELLSHPSAPRQPDKNLPHSELGSAYLTQFFPATVTEPIRLHVHAKRYLCTVDTSYWSALSPASQTSFVIQGGVFSHAEVEAFLAHPHAQRAIALRRWDDQAKIPQQVTPTLEHYISMITSYASLPPS